MNVCDVTPHELIEILTTSHRLVLVDFWAPWCGPCRAMKPDLMRYAEKHTEDLDVYCCNVDKDPETADRFNIFSIPTLILFLDGRPLHTMIGKMSCYELEQELASFIKETA